MHDKMTFDSIFAILWKSRMISLFHGYHLFYGRTAEVESYRAENERREFTHTHLHQ